mmetsp:Transcript_82188/g.220019  ORF Transcript_82188/g.220019 Transcript_82188/m.220019 type:complete len:205 (-) Transcript_82188:44-658(-)
MWQEEDGARRHKRHSKPTVTALHWRYPPSSSQSKTSQPNYSTTIQRNNVLDVAQDLQLVQHAVALIIVLLLHTRRHLHQPLPSPLLRRRFTLHVRCFAGLGARLLPQIVLAVPRRLQGRLLPGLHRGPLVPAAACIASVLLRVALQQLLVQLLVVCQLPPGAHRDLVDPHAVALRLRRLLQSEPRHRGHKCQGHTHWEPESLKR